VYASLKLYLPDNKNLIKMITLHYITLNHTFALSHLRTFVNSPNSDYIFNYSHPHSLYWTQCSPIIPD